MLLTRPLPAREPPQPGESLTSLIRRHAVAMGYDRVKSLRSLLEGLRLPPHLDHLGRGPPLEALAKLLGQTEESLLDLTIHAYANRLVLVPSTEPPAQSLDSKTAGRFFDCAQPRVCPACLVEPPSYERLLWQFRPLATCTRHGCLLVNRCPTCQRRLVPYRLDVNCCRCSTDLRGSSVVAVSAEVTSLEVTVCSWLSRRASPEASMPVVARFWWLERLAAVILRTPSWLVRVRREHSLPDAASEPAVAWLAAARIAVRDPAELAAFLDSFQVVAKHLGTSTGVSRAFGLLLRESAQLEGLGYPAAASALREYLVARYTQGHLNSKVCLFRAPQFRQQIQKRPWITQTAAALLLKVRPVAIGALVEQGQLAGHLTPAGTRGRTIGLVRRDSVEAFQHRQSTALSVIQAAIRLGIGRRCIFDLIHAGSLPGAVRSKAGWRIPEETIEAILADCRRQPPLEVACSPWISLRHATRQFGAQGIDLVQVLQLVRNGRLAARRTPGNEKLEGLFVDAEILGHVAIVAQSERIDREGVSLQKLGRILLPGQPLKDVVLRKWIRAGLLTAERRGRAWRIAPEEVTRFRTTYCLATEACGILAITRSTLNRWESAGKVSTVYSRRTHPEAGASVFLRGDITKFAR